MTQNPFEALCVLASSQTWCWRMPCTTCGQMHFHYAFYELVSGRSPTDDDWPVQGSLKGYSRPERSLMPPNYSDEEKDQILTICSEASIGHISSECKFPDWLGYLGLILLHMRQDSERYKQLSSTWASQLAELFDPSASTYSKLKLISHGNHGVLSWALLAECELYLELPRAKNTGIYS